MDLILIFCIKFTNLLCFAFHLLGATKIHGNQTETNPKKQKTKNIIIQIHNKNQMAAIYFVDGAQRFFPHVLHGRPPEDFEDINQRLHHSKQPVTLHDLGGFKMRSSVNPLQGLTKTPFISVHHCLLVVVAAVVVILSIKALSLPQQEWFGPSKK